MLKKKTLSAIELCGYLLNITKYIPQSKSQHPDVKTAEVSSKSRNKTKMPIPKICAVNIKQSTQKIERNQRDKNWKWIGNVVSTAHGRIIHFKGPKKPMEKLLQKVRIPFTGNM